MDEYGQPINKTITWIGNLIIQQVGFVFTSVRHGPSIFHPSEEWPKLRVLFILSIHTDPEKEGEEIDDEEREMPGGRHSIMTVYSNHETDARAKNMLESAADRLDTGPGGGGMDTQGPFGNPLRSQ